MKKLNKLVAILVAMAMMLTLGVVSAFAGEGDETIDPVAGVAITKEMKVPTGTAIPANSNVKFSFTLVEKNTVAVSDAEPIVFPVSLNGNPVAQEVNGATTRYYFTTGNIIEQLGIANGDYGVYKFNVTESEYKLNNQDYTAVNAEDHKNAAIETTGNYVVKVFYSSEGKTAQVYKDGEKIPMDIGEDAESVEANELKYVDSYFEDDDILEEEETGDPEADTKLFVKKTLDAEAQKNTPADATFKFQVTLDVPDIQGANVVAKIHRDATDTDEDADLSTFIYLGANDYLYFEELPIGTIVTATEEDDRAADAATDGKMYVKSGEQTTPYTMTAAQKAITVQNAYNTTIEEGVLTTNLPYIVLALVAVGGMVAYMIVRRKADDEA